MSYSGGKIAAPINVSDVAAALSVASGDVGTLCAHSANNKWAKYKPVRVAGVYGTLTDAQRAAVKYGFTVDETTSSQGFGSPETEGSLSYKLLHGTETWHYDKPRGCTVSPYEPYRLTDYVSGDATTTRGYKTAAVMPLEFISARGESGDLTVKFRVRLADGDDNVQLSDVFGGYYFGVFLYQHNSTPDQLWSWKSSEQVLANTDYVEVVVDCDDGDLWQHKVGLYTNAPTSGNQMSAVGIVSNVELGQLSFPQYASVMAAMDMGASTFTYWRDVYEFSPGGDLDYEAKTVAWGLTIYNHDGVPHTFGTITVTAEQIGGGGEISSSLLLRTVNSLTVSAGGSWHDFGDATSWPSLEEGYSHYIVVRENGVTVAAAYIG